MLHLRFAPGVDRGSTPTAAGVDDVPFEPLVRRLRIRRGGPRTPLPLLPVIAVAAGIGIAYVNQTAHVTTATYQATKLLAGLPVESILCGSPPSTSTSGDHAQACIDVCCFMPVVTAPRRDLPSSNTFAVGCAL